MPPLSSAASGSVERVTTGSSRASGGKSHSWVTATRLPPRPSAKSDSVALGRSETMRMRGLTIVVHRDGRPLRADVVGRQGLDAGPGSGARAGPAGEPAAELPRLPERPGALPRHPGG